jgi:GH43 family beta-xylosidase
MKGCFPVYESLDLEDWDGPFTAFKPTENFWADRDFWAPEVHKYGGAYYMFASFKSDSRKRGTQILKAESPKGPFLPISDGPVTPKDWSSLDGTLYIEDGVPYMIFCHEWIQIQNGTVCGMRLTEDLKKADGEPFVLWHALEAPWIASVHGEGNFVTDGPFVVKHNDKLCCIWASFVKDGGYCEGIAYSDNGKIDGKWLVSDNLVFKDDGGHGMIFYSITGQMYLSIHSPNSAGDGRKETPVFIAIREENGTLVWDN